MPVHKYRSVEEMPATWRSPGDPALYRAIERVWAFGQRWTRPHFPPGVYKQRSIEDMNALDERWAAANFEAFQLRQEAARRDSARNVSMDGVAAREV